MATLTRASDVTLYELENKFKLQFFPDEDNQFFPEWQTDLSNIQDADKQVLNDIKASYFNLVKHPALLENIVQLSVLGPLLQLAKLFLQPYWLKSEVSVAIATADEDMRIEGKIDTLILRDHLWVLVIESKRMALSIETGLAQILAYMLATPHPEQPAYGLITNGGSFIFVKLLAGENPRYALSRRFELLNPGNELYSVLSILKRFGQMFFGLTGKQSNSTGGSL